MNGPQLGYGQVAPQLDESVAADREQTRDLIRLSDPALSELGFDPLLDELLIRVRDLLGVDTAAILLLDEERKQLVARAAKGIEEEVERGVRIPIGRGFAGRIAKERTAIFIADVDHADIMNPILREKGIRSLLGVPLIVEGELIGVLHIGSLRARMFTQRDLAVLELAAARAAPAIERARLMSALAREHRNAVMLQRSLLPRRLIEAPGVSVAARYMPARDEVGGDWYDTIELPNGQVGLAIGDIVGHGLGAAALMGQFRTALRAYALNRNSPGRTLELVDHFARALDEDTMATAAYAVVDLDTGQVTYASAGHLPPILVPADRDPWVFEAAPAPPLGAFSYRPCPEYEFTLEPGDIMLMYTDGLVERPRVSLDVSIAKLTATLQGVQTSEEACLTAMDRLVPQRGPHDDVAVLAVRREHIPTTLELDLPARPTVLSYVRREIRRWLHGHGLEEDVVSEITIAVGEAAANAVEHAYGPGRGSFRLCAVAHDGVIIVSVRDRGRWRDPRGEHRGRGLGIMRAAMDSVEISAGEDGSEIVMRRAVNRR
jgi:serine phosphatase RsbU (regulator of sigma subunit)/anti-sigma regulatory factor (Ser/Thr protein kinase)